jgi:hypothetical protein
MPAFAGRANLPQAIALASRGKLSGPSRRYAKRGWRKGDLALPTELPVRRRSRPASGLELVALASLLPWCLSVLLVRYVPSVAQAFLLMGQIE